MSYIIILVKIRVDDDNGWNDIIYKYINGIVLFRNYYFNIKKVTLYDETIFQSFVIDQYLWLTPKPNLF